MRYIFTCILMISLCRLGMAQINRAEYFIDSDPGFGNGTPVAFSPSSTIDPTFNVPLTSVSNGFHILYMRVRDLQGRWSITHEHVFFNTEFSSANQTLKTAEYFIDTDPGFGKGISVPIAANQNDATIPFNVNLSDVSIGAHTLYVRVSDKGNIWSQVIQHAFFVKPGGDLSNIVAFKYNFERAGFTSDTLIYQDFEPAPSISLNFNTDLSGLSSDAEYTMNIWAISSDGLQSLVTTKKIKACSSLPAKAKFDFIPLGTQVSFIDSSANGLKYHWDFGDGKTDTISNPMHTYDIGGIYEVKLVVSNFCNSDTLTKKIVVLDLQSISPRKGGDNGSITVNITGGGFSDSTKVFLTNGNLEIKGEFIKATKEGNILTAIFNLEEKEIGIYDVIVKDSKHEAVSLIKAFEIEKGREPKLWVEIVGRSAFRTGRVQSFKVRYGNEGNVDAYMVPITLLYPKGIIVELNNPLLKLSGLNGSPVFDEENTPLTFDIRDSTLLSVIVPTISANNSGEFEILLTSPKQSDFELSAWVNRPLISSIITSSRSGRIHAPSNEECYNTYIGLGLTALGLIPDATCAVGVTIAMADLATSFHGFMVMTPGQESVPDVLVSTTGFVASVAGLGVAGLVCAGVAIAEPVTKALTLIGLAVTAYGVVTEGYECFTGIPSYFIDLRSINSFDPNEKVGPKGKNMENYLQGQTPLNYKIYFENLGTASAPAQEVIIADTLDKNVLDVGSFSLTSFGFGKDVSVTIPQGLLAYSTNIDLRSRKNMIVRVDAKIDTSSGVLTWRFLSLDPNTMELTDDPLDGFLPPNVASPQGEGFISFSVKPMQGLASGTQIRNKATIYFDANPPIATNTYLNTIDKIIPISSVNSLSTTVQDTIFTVKWAGNDQGSGVRSYDVYYSVNNGPFKLWQYDITATEARFIGQKDSTYGFYSISKDYAGNIENAKTQAETTTQIVTGITSIKDQGWLFKGYPNPFKSETIIEFELPSPQSIILIVRDIHGKEIATLVDNKLYGKGNQKVLFNNAHLPAGFYFCELKSGKYFQTIKLLKF